MTAQADISRAGARTRNLALDLTKGVLVIFMVAYHSLNYSTQRELGFAYFAFLPPSFILITGFLISNHYLARYSKSPSEVTRRLIIRGAKLLLIFTALNVAAMTLMHSRARGEMPGLPLFFDHWFDIYVTGNARLATFEILLPIAYVLLLAPALLWVGTRSRYALASLSVITVVGLMLLERRGIVWNGVQMLSAGLIGILLGLITRTALDRIARWGWLAIPCYALCFWLAKDIGYPYPLQIIAAVLVLIASYSLCALLSASWWIVRRVEVLGQYSLIAYITQIAILVFLSRAIGMVDPQSLEFLGLFTGALLLTILAVEAINWVRAKSSPADVAYKAVFA